MSIESADEKKFDSEQARDRLKQLYSEWESEWVKTTLGNTHGPHFIPDRVRQHMSSDQLAAEQPETDAYVRFTETCVNTILDAMEFGQHTRAIQIVLEVMSELEHSHPKYAFDTLGHIFHETVDRKTNSEQQ